MRGNFTNTFKLVKLILRRERVVSALWVACLLLFTVGLAPAMSNMFDGASRASYAATMNNPAMIALMGPIYGAENYTAGAMYSNTMLLWAIIAVAIMNIFLVVRHTRADEEKGRGEVVRSLPTGRLANLNAAMLTAVIVNVALGLLTGLGIAVMGIESMSFGGSMLYGAVLCVSGLFFAAAAALFSQLSSSSRGATGLSLAALGLIYLLRAAGDMGSEALSLISPMGMIQRSQLYVENHWWPVLVLLLETAVVAVVAFALNAIRDIDQGFIHAKPGKSNASSWLRSPLGLALRLLRNVIIAWVLGIFILAASYGSILGDIDSFVAGSEFYSMVIGTNENYTTSQMFVAMVTSIMTLIALVPVLTVSLKARSEEKEGHAEHVLSRGVSRGRYLSGYLLLALGTSVLIQCANAVGIYAAAAVVLPNPADLPLGYLMQANLVYIPAFWVMTGLTMLLTGFLPKASAAIWGYYGFSFFAAFVGRIPDILPNWLTKLTPFGYIPQLPTDEINLVTLAVLTVIAAALTAAGFAFYKRREMVM